jgi:AcrR family transcriptional regulator
MVSLPDHLMSVPVGREPLPRDVVADHQREHILLTAAELFAKRGYPGTSVDHLVAAAKVGVGSFYSFFDGKEDCFLTVYERVVAHFWAQIADAVPTEGAWSERVCAALRAILEAITAEPLAARIAIVEVQTAGPDALARYESTHDRIVPILRAGRELGAAADELPATLEEATIGGVAWLLHQRLVMGEIEGIRLLYPDLVEIVLGPYLGEAEAARLAAAGD